jgi:hypothetical protein
MTGVAEAARMHTGFTNRSTGVTGHELVLMLMPTNRRDEIRSGADDRTGSPN